MFIAQVEMCIAKPEGFSSNSGTDIIPWRDVAGGREQQWVIQPLIPLSTSKKTIPCKEGAWARWLKHHVWFFKALIE